MQHLTLTIIRDEHRALAAMLRSMLLLLEQARRQHALPDFSVLRAMLLYIDEYPERLHHTKESELLFPKIRLRVPDMVDVLTQLDQEHANGERAVRHLEHLLLAFDVLGEPRREAFEEAAARYVDFYLAHMRVEDVTILPAAVAHLSASDWDELDQAFSTNRDPLTGADLPDAYRPLFLKILNTAPAPIGLA